MRFALFVGLIAASPVAFIACTTSSETSNIPIIPNVDAAPVPGSDASVPRSEAGADDASAMLPVDAGPTSCLVDPTPYVQTWKPARQGGGCGTGGIDDFINACSSVTSASCQDFRSKNPTCAACLFGSASDPEWALYVADPTAPGAVDGYRYNYGGCVQLETGNETCGKVYQAELECPHVACDTCSKADFKSCASKSFNSATSCAQHTRNSALFCNALGLIDMGCATVRNAARTFCE